MRLVWYGRTWATPFIWAKQMLHYFTFFTFYFCYSLFFILLEVLNHWQPLILSRSTLYWDNTWMRGKRKEWSQSLPSKLVPVFVRWKGGSCYVVVWRVFMVDTTLLSFSFSSMLQGNSLMVIVELLCCVFWSQLRVQIQ